MPYGRVAEVLSFYEEIAKRMKAFSPILVLCEDGDCRPEAVAFCDRLVRRFWTSCEFDIDWLTFDDLSEQDKFEAAVNQATFATMLVSSMRPGSPLPPAVQAWAEAWAEQRGEREGSIVALGDPGHIAGGG